MTAMLRDHRKGAISLTEPYEASAVQGGIEYIRDKRHETLDDAATFFDERHIWLEQFEQFVVVMRSPYELELSCFAYLLKDLPWDRGKAQELVLEGGFRQYLATALFFGMNPPGLDLYYHVEGHIPDLSMVFINWVSPSRAKNSVCRGTRSEFEQTSAITVRRLREGGQSIST